MARMAGPSWGGLMDNEKVTPSRMGTVLVLVLASGLAAGLLELAGVVAWWGLIGGVEPAAGQSPAPSPLPVDDTWLSNPPRLRAVRARADAAQPVSRPERPGAWPAFWWPSLFRCRRCRRGRGPLLFCGRDAGGGRGPRPRACASSRGPRNRRFARSRATGGLARSAGSVVRTGRSPANRRARSLPSHSPGGRNIALVVLDPVCADARTPYGSTRDTTPTLARLAAQVRFQTV